MTPDFPDEPRLSEPPDHWDASALRERCMGNEKLMNQVLKRFQLTLDREATDLAAAWNAADLNRLAAIAHRLKGTAATVGAFQLEAISREIEERARGGRREELSSWLVRLSSERTHLTDLISNSLPSASA